MASKTLIIMEDDTDGSEATQTVSFALDGASYEIDLSDENAESLRGSLEQWVNAARRIGGRRRAGSAKAAVADAPVDTKLVREWAVANGIEISSRGRISASVLEQYNAAN